MVVLITLSYYYNDLELKENEDKIFSANCKFLDYKLTVDQYNFKSSHNLVKEQYELKCLDINDGGKTVK